VECLHASLQWWQPAAGTTQSFTSNTLLAAYRPCCYARVSAAAVVQYMLLGSNQQPVSLVLDTGSASLYTDGFQVSASSTAVSTGINPIFGYGSGAVEGKAASGS
jgi:hypothetical protein